MFKDEAYREAVKAYVQTIRGHLRELEDEYIVKEMMIRGEVLKRDFTKRQQNIIWFIYTFSFYYGKDKALIPRLQDFELCGIGRTKIKQELDKLINMNVIEHNELLSLYGITDPSKWLAPYHAGYNPSRSQELFLLNLRDAGVPVEKLIKQMKGNN